MEQLLRNPEISPLDEVLEKEFRDWHEVYFEFISEIQKSRFSFLKEWRYYKDGKAWLCKITHKKKTIVWLSAWERYFKLGFYFTEKSGSGIKELKISENLGQQYETNIPIGRLKPLVVDVNQQSQLEDVYCLLNYKVGCK